MDSSQGFFMLLWYWGYVGSLHSKSWCPLLRCPWSSWADPGACGSFIPTSRLSCLATRPRGLEHLSSWPHRESSSFALHPPGTSCQSQDPELFYISTALAGPFTLNWVKDESRELRVPEGPVCWFLNILLSLSDNSGLCIASLWSCQT